MSGERPTIPCGTARLALGARTYVMGIVNVTPDSFSDGGRALTVDDALRQGLSLLENGADVLDVGGESTRPGASPVDPATERARVLPVLDALVAHGVTAISVDTRRAEVARAARDHGAAWWNDVSALDDHGALALAPAFDAVVLMHMRGQPATMQSTTPSYDDVVHDVARFLDERVVRAEQAGVGLARILVDPGIGFGKTTAHNLVLSRSLAAIRGRAAGVLYGPSRKRFLGELTGEAEASARDAATVGAVVAGALSGADIVRVHDAHGARRALMVSDAIARAG